MNSNKLMYILVGVIGAAVLLTVVLVLRNIGGTRTEAATLQFWGVFDERTSFDASIKEFRAAYPGIDVKYRQLSYSEYEQQLVNSLAAGTGPDVIMIHNTWLPKHGDKLTAMPAGIPDTKNPMTLQEFKNQFVDVAVNDLSYSGQIYAMPLYVDTLALYYNKDLFNSAGIARPPRTWEDVNTAVELLTKYDARGNITQSGFALGTARNINRSTDILMDMMIQSGVQMTSADNRSATFAAAVSGQRVGEIALRYYTDFANSSKQTYTWNDSQHYSIDAFTEGSLAMMAGYAHQGAVIRTKAPRLNFAVAPMPQASTEDVRDFANYWAVAVPTKSAHPVEAWQFVNFLTSKEGVTGYLNATGRPSARRDLIDLQRADPEVGVFAVQALSARSWYQVDSTTIESIFASMIDDVNFGRASVAEALGQAAAKVNVLMGR